MKKIKLNERTQNFINSIRNDKQALKINIISFKEMLNDYKTMSYEEFHKTYPLSHKDITEEEISLELKELRKALRELKQQ